MHAFHLSVKVLRWTAVLLLLSLRPTACCYDNSAVLFEWALGFRWSSFFSLVIPNAAHVCILVGAETLRLAIWKDDGMPEAGSATTGGREDRARPPDVSGGSRIDDRRVGPPVGDFDQALELLLRRHAPGAPSEGLGRAPSRGSLVGAGEGRRSPSQSGHIVYDRGTLCFIAGVGSKNRIT